MSGDGFCKCGCGQQTKLAPRTVTAYGWRKGEPLHYRKGHNANGPGPEYLIDPDTGCWNWNRAKNKNGYGKACPGGGVEKRAHRVIYERHKGPIPEGLELDHLCRNPPCVNPDHLEPVTHAENIRRARAKLTVEIAREIRSSSEPAKVLAARYGVAVPTIYSVRNGVSWVAV